MAHFTRNKQKQREKEKEKLSKSSSSSSSSSSSKSDNNLSSPESELEVLNLKQCHWLEIMMDTFRIKRYKSKILFQYTLYILKTFFQFKQSILDKHCKRPNTVFSVIIMTIFRLVYKFIDDDHYMLSSFNGFIGYKLSTQKWFELEAYIFGKLNWNLLKIIEECIKVNPPSIKWDRLQPHNKDIIYTAQQQEIIQRVSNIVQDI